MQYSLSVDIKSSGYYGPYDFYLGGVFVGQRQYDGSDYVEMTTEFVEGLGNLVVRNLGNMWSVNRQEEEDW